MLSSKFVIFLLAFNRGGNTCPHPTAVILLKFFVFKSGYFNGIHKYCFKSQRQHFDAHSPNQRGLTHTSCSHFNSRDATSVCTLVVFKNYFIPECACDGAEETLGELSGAIGNFSDVVELGLGGLKGSPFL